MLELITQEEIQDKMLRFVRSIKVFTSFQIESCYRFFKRFVGSKMKSDRSQLIVETPTASSSSPPWHLLPHDLLAIIFKNLWVGDRVRSRLVCKLWEQVLTQYRIPQILEAPWQILSNDSYKKPESFQREIRFRSLSEKRIYRFRFCNQLARGGWFCGSSRGWLLIATLNADMFLWQPISGETRKLPPLCALPFFNELNYTKNLSRVVHRVEVFSIDSIECIVVVIFKKRNSDEIALCTPNEETWKILSGGEFQPHYSDILYHSTTRELTVLATNILLEDQQDFLSNHKFFLTDCTIPVSAITMLINITTVSEAEFPLGLQLAHQQSNIFHLIESTLPHKLLVICASLDCIASEKDDDNESIARFRCQQTTGFSVDILDYEKLEVETLSSIGEETIYLGSAGSFSIPTTERVDADSIYFATDDAEGFALVDGAKEHYIVREHGVFSFQHDRIQQASFTTRRYFSGSKVGWFTPLLCKGEKRQDARPNSPYIRLLGQYIRRYLSF